MYSRNLSALRVLFTFFFLSFFFNLRLFDTKEEKKRELLKIERGEVGKRRIDVKDTVSQCLEGTGSRVWVETRAIALEEEESSVILGQLIG